MALELDKISFAVDTQALEQATAKVQELTAALAAMGKMPTVTAGGIAATNGSGESKVEKGVKRTKKTVEDLQKTLDQTAKDIADGFSKSEAVVLRNARAMKATDDQVKQLKESLVSLRKDSDKPVVAPSVTKGVADLGDKVDKVTYTLEKQKIAMDVLRGTTLQLSDGELSLQRVYTNGQANRIAALKLQGASTDQMMKYTTSVKDLNKILGVNPFDQSASGVEKLTKNITELNSVNALMREGLGLTRQQVIALARDIESERQKFASLGMSTDGADFAARINQIKQETSLKAKQYNTLIEDAKNADKVAVELANNQRKQQEEAQRLATDIGRQKHIDLKNSIDAEIKGVEERSKEWKKYYEDQEKSAQMLEKQRSQAVYQEFKQTNSTDLRAQEDAANRVAKAQAFLDKESSRASNALAGLKGEIQGVDSAVGVSTANRLDKYSKELKQAGVAADVAEERLRNYSKTLIEVDRLNKEKGKKEQLDRLDYAARATSVQLGDIGISLAGGQNPLLVMIQQGDQLRGVLTQAALSGDELKQVMSQASLQIVQGFIDVGTAANSFIVGAFEDTGDALVDFVSKASGVDFITDKLLEKFPALNGMIGSMSKGVRILAGIGIVSSIATIVALGVALTDVIKQESALSKAVAESGVSMGLSKQAALDYALSLSEVNGSVTKTVDVLTLMASEGVFVKESIDDITKSAIDMDKYLGVSIDKTVSKYADMVKGPSDALSEIAHKTGLVSVETLQLVSDLEEEGKTREAAIKAIEVYSEVTKAQAEIARLSLSPVEKLWLNIKTAVSGVWDEFTKLTRTGPIISGLTIGFAMFAAVVDSAWSFVKLLAKAIGGFFHILTTEESGISGMYNAFKRVKDDILGDVEGLGARTKLRFSTEDTDGLRSGLQQVTEEMKLQADVNGKLASFRKDQDRYADNQVKREKEIIAYQNKYSGLLKNNLITQAEYDKGLELINKKYKDSPVARSAEEKFTDKSIRLFTRDAAEAEGKMNDLTKSQVDLLKVVASPEWAKADHKKIIDAYQIALAIDLENQKTEKQLVLYKQMIEAEKDYVDLLAKRHAENKAALITGMKQIDDAVELQNDLEFQMKIIGMTADEQKRLTAERKAYVELQKELADIEKKGEGVDKNTLRAYANTAYNQKLQNINTQSGLDKLIEADKLQQSIADALVTGLTEGGKSGAAKLRSILQAELMKPITVFIKAQLNSLTSGGIPGMTNQIGAGGTSTLGSIVQGLSSAGIGMSLQKGISGGYSTGESKLVDTITAAASAYFGPIAGAAVGVFNRAFGRKLTDSGVQGQYSGNSFAGNSYSFSKGGLFRSNKTSTSALDPAMQQMLNTTYQGIDKTFTYFADKFDTTVTSSVDAIKVNLLGLSESEAQAKLSEAIAGSVKKTLDAINLPKWAENVVSELGDKFSVESMQNALAGIVAMKDALDNLGAASDAFAGITSDATSELIAEFGGIQTATQSLSSYFQNFYPEEQRIEIATTALNKQLAKLGVAIPDSTAAYKALVDDALIAGNEELAANLISLSGAFYEIKNAVEAMTSSVIDEADRLRGEIVGSNSASTVGKTAMLAEFGMMTQLARAGDKSAIEKLPELSKQIEETVKNQAVSQVEVTKIQSYLSNSLYATSQQLGAALPAYVSAINSNQTSVSNLSSNSSVLSPVIQPAGNTASSTAASSQATNAARVEMLLTSLVDNISGLRDEIRADVSHNAKTAKILDRAMQDGQSLTVTVLA